MKRIDETDTIENERPVWDLYGPDPILGEIIKIPPEAELDLQAELEKRHYTQSEIETLISVFGRHVIHLPHIKESPKGEAKYKDVSVETVWDLPRFIISKGELNKQFPNPLSGGKIRPNELAGGAGNTSLCAVEPSKYICHAIAKAITKSSNCPDLASGLPLSFLTKLKHSFNIVSSYIFNPSCLTTVARSSNILGLVEADVIHPIDWDSLPSSRVKSFILNSEG